MIKTVVLPILVGCVLGYTIIEAETVDFLMGTPVTVLLCIMLFLVGILMGQDKELAGNLKKTGIRLFMFPIAMIIGSLAGAAAASIILPITMKGAMSAAAGLGWYSLTPMLVAEYSAEVSAIAFLHNVMREVFGMMLVPFVAKYFGYIESTVLMGTAGTDVGMILTEKATGRTDIPIYSFVCGLVPQIIVPVFVPLVVNIPFLP